MLGINLYFDYRDIFKAPRLAGGKNIWIFLTGNLVGYVIYWTLTIFSFILIDGISLSDIIKNSGLYPCLFGHTAPIISWIIYWLGILIWIFCIFLSGTAVSQVTLNRLKGNDFFSSQDAWDYSKKNWHPVIFSPFAILIIIATFILFAMIFAFICKIPVLGSFLYVLPYPIYIFGSIFTIYSFIVFIISMVYVPSIVGIYEEDTMGTVFQSYAITISQPWRIILYNFILIPLSYLAITFLSWVFHASIGLMNLIFGFVVGKPFENIFSFASSIVFPDKIVNYINSRLSLLDLTYLIPDINISYSYLSVIDRLAGIILSLSLFLICLSVLSYGLSVLSVGHSLAFIIFKKISDDDNVLERKTEKELDIDKILSGDDQEDKLNAFSEEE